MTSRSAALLTPLSGEAQSISYRYAFANVVFDESIGRVEVGDAEVALEPRPRNLLSEFLRRPGEVIAKDELLLLLWQGRPTVDNVLANAVNKLRKALGDEGGRRIVNLPRVGYRFDGPIERIVVGRQTEAPLGLAVGAPVPSRPGFVLERSLGQRTHSEVWLARDPKLHEVRVFKFASDGEGLANLKREYTIYRVLRSELGERDDFTRILSANFSDTPCFIECEYGGLDLLTWAQETQELQVLSQDERIGLFLQIARTVAAAHRVGVLHKDLKPSNVLISPRDSGWLVKLTDFGSSRLLQAGRLKELGVTMMGMTVTQGADAGTLQTTPLYVAPELLAGGVPSTQSDLYALGLMLYQLIVADLRRPMTTGWQRDVDDPLLREDLIAATEGRPEDRLGSVAALVDRLERLPSRRIEADRLAADRVRVEDALRRLQRTRARRPWVVVAFVSMALGLVTCLWFYTQTREALRVAKQQSVLAESINDFLTKDLLQSADISQSSDVKPLTAFDVIQRASARASKRFDGQPRAEASVRYRLARSYMRLGNLSEADREVSRAVDLLRPLVPANDPLLLSIRFTHVRLYLREHDYRAEAGALLDATLADAGATIDGSNELALLAARAQFERVEYDPDIEKSRKAGLHVIALADRLDDFDERLEGRRALVAFYRRFHRDDDAKRLLDELSRPPFNDTTADAVSSAKNIADRTWTLLNEGKNAEAERVLIESRDRASKELGPNDVQVGMTHSELGRVYAARGDHAKAAASLRAAVASFTAALGEDHQYTNVTTVNLGASEVLAGHPEVALQLFDKVRPWFKVHATHGYFPNLELKRSRALSDLGRYDEAWRGLQVIDPTIEGVGSLDEAMTAEYDAERGVALIGMGRLSEGLPLLKQAMAKKQKLERTDFEMRLDDARIGRLIEAATARSLSARKS